jgi:hypothetical protein
MRRASCLDLICLGLIAVACLVFASCRKQTVSQKILPQATRQSRLDWNLKTLIGAYEQSGGTNAKWDESAKRALTEFAHSRSSGSAMEEDSIQIIGTNCRAAVESGCDDPMVRYLYIRFAMDQTNTPQDFAKALCDVALDLHKSSYPNIRKFFAAIRALDQLTYAYGTNVSSKPVLRQIQPLVGQFLLPTIQDKTLPPEEAYQVCKEALQQLRGDANKSNYARAYSTIEGPIFDNWPNESASWLLKGEAYIQKAWNVRGGGYADTVTAEGARGFAADLAVAEKSLQRAWELNPNDPRIAVQMIWVELGQGKGRDRMELWFQNAMRLDPNNYDACNTKLLYIEPKWYGSVQDMLDFGRECVQNSQWGGRVPLTLVDGHSDIYEQYTAKSKQTNYWKQPEVWLDVKAAYDRYFAVNPKAIGMYKYYARHAWSADQWAAFNDLVPKVRPLDYDCFGGKNEFEKMVQLAKTHLDPAAPKP